MEFQENGTVHVTGIPEGTARVAVYPIIEMMRFPKRGDPLYMVKPAFLQKKLHATGSRSVRVPDGATSVDVDGVTIFPNLRITGLRCFVKAAPTKDEPSPLFVQLGEDVEFPDGRKKADADLAAKIAIVKGVK